MLTWTSSFLNSSINTAIGYNASSPPVASAGATVAISDFLLFKFFVRVIRHANENSLAKMT